MLNIVTLLISDILVQFWGAGGRRVRADGATGCCSFLDLGLNN